MGGSRHTSGVELCSNRKTWTKLNHNVAERHTQCPDLTRVDYYYCYAAESLVF